jgi:hypothetical protein
MQPEDLSVKERAVLFALLGEAREVSNPELAEHAGFRLDGKERRKLNDLKLVNSRKAGRTYAHELTDAGWRWCATELSAGLPAKASSTEGALYVVLAGFARYLDYTDQSLADIFRWRSTEADAAESHGIDGQSIDDLIKTAYRSLAAEPAEFVKIRELRAKLPDIPRAELDSALERMYRTQQVNLVPQSNQQALTNADRDVALRIGGEAKHMISVSRG